MDLEMIIPSEVIQTERDLEMIIPSEVIQTERDKYDVTYKWNLKKKIQMNLSTKQKQSYRLGKQIDGYQRGE